MEMQKLLILIRIQYSFSIVDMNRITGIIFCGVYARLVWQNCLKFHLILHAAYKAFTI